MNRPLKITTLARRYLDHQRRLGYSLRGRDGRLMDFAAYCDREAAGQPITTARAVAWANQTTAGPTAINHRLGITRSFATYCANLDPRTEVPPQGLFGPTRPRARPHVFTEAEVVRLMLRARRLPSRFAPLRPFTFEALIGFLACTGMRPGEALLLKLKDFDVANGTIRVPALKASPERVLPLHPTTVAALKAYQAKRREICPMGEYLFTGEYGRRISRTSFSAVMQRLLRGFKSKGVRAVVRPYDLRHTFATKLVAQWSKEEAPVGHRLLLLTHYLGHAHFTHTWWYVSGQGGALRAAARQFEAFVLSNDGTDL